MVPFKGGVVVRKIKKGVVLGGRLKNYTNNKQEFSQQITRSYREAKGVSDELKRKIDRGRCSEERKKESRGQRVVLLIVEGDLCLDSISFKLSGGRA